MGVGVSSQIAALEGGGRGEAATRRSLGLLGGRRCGVEDRHYSWFFFITEARWSLTGTSTGGARRLPAVSAPKASEAKSRPRAFSPVTRGRRERAFCAVCPVPGSCVRGGEMCSVRAVWEALMCRELSDGRWGGVSDRN